MGMITWIPDQQKAAERWRQQLTGRRRIPSECDHRRKIFYGEGWACDDCGKVFENLPVKSGGPTR